MTFTRRADVARRRRTAHVITEVTSPTVLAPALLVVVAIDEQVRHGHDALAWGLVAAVFVGAFPLGFLKLGVRAGRWDDHHVRRRELRRLPLVFAGGSVLCGIVLLLAGHAPGAITALVVAMLAGLIIVLALSYRWKVSIHSAVAGGTLIVLTAVFGPVGLIIGVLVAAGAGWSRVASSDHTIAQVGVGALLGALAALLYFPLR